jgi:hypothetical protein
VGVYVRDYFGPKRYTCLEPSARSHSLPIIDGELQKPGGEYRARDFKYENDVVSLDISPAYGIFDSDERIDRSFELYKRGFRLTDRFSFNKKREVTERIVTRIEPDLSSGGKILLDGVSVKYDTAKWDCRLAGAEPSARDRRICYFIDFSPKCEISEFSLDVDVE